LLTKNNKSKFEERVALWEELVQFSSSLPKEKFTTEELNKKRVVQMVVDGRLSAASASLLSDALSDPSEENLAKLQEKHSAQDVPVNIPPHRILLKQKLMQSLFYRNFDLFQKVQQLAQQELVQPIFFILFKSTILHQHLMLSRILFII